MNALLEAPAHEAETVERARMMPGSPGKHAESPGIKAAQAASVEATFRRLTPDMMTSNDALKKVCFQWLRIDVAARSCFIKFLAGLHDFERADAPLMSNRVCQSTDSQRAVKQHGRKLSLRRLSACIGLSLGALVLTVACSFLFNGAILNRYVKGKAERAFAEAHQGRVADRRTGLRGGANCLVAQSSH